MAGGSVRTSSCKCRICGAIGEITELISYGGGNSSFHCPFWSHDWHVAADQAIRKTWDVKELIGEKRRLVQNQAFPKTYREEAERETAELEAQLPELQRLEGEACRHAVEQREKEEQEAKRRQAEEERAEKKQAQAKIARKRRALRAELATKSQEEIIEIILKARGLLK